MIWLLLAIPAQVLAVTPNFGDDGWVFDGQKNCFKLTETVDGYCKLHETVDGYCKLTETVDGYSAGQAMCESLGGNLGVPNSYVTDVIYRGSASNWVWTGVTTEDHKVWSSEYTDWFGNQPSNGNGKGCAAMGDYGRTEGVLSFAPGWIEVDCGTTLGLLCEKPCEDCTVDHDCPEGWKQDRKSNGHPGDNCYKLSSDKKTWEEAQSECEKSDSHLAHISNNKTNFLYEHMVRSPVYAVWIGYQKVNNKWVDTDAQPMSFNNWFPGFPDNFGGNENCAELRDFGNTNPWIEKYGFQIGDGDLPFVPGWNDHPCFDKNQYICQKKVGASDAATTDATTDAATIGFNCFQFTIIFVLGLLFRQ